MKKLLKHGIAYMLIISMLMTQLVVTSFAASGNAFQTTAAETVKAGDAFTVSFTQPTDLTMSSLGLTITFDNEAFEITGIAEAPHADMQPAVAGGNSNGKVSISYTDTTNSASTTLSAGTVLLSITFKVKDSATAGKKNFTVFDYNVAGNYVASDYDYEDITPNDAVIGSKTLSVEIVEESAGGGEDDSTDSYSATLGSNKSDHTVRVDEEIEVSITANGSAFNAAQMELTYDATYLTYKADSATGGTNLQVDSSVSGKLILSDFGGEKAAGTVYKVSFIGKAVTDGTTPVTISKIGFSEQGDAEEDLVWLTTLPTALNVTVAKKLHTVVLPEGFVPSTGTANDERTYEVEDGSSFSFTPTDTNYTYTFTGATVNRVEDTDTYTVASVTGNLTITQASKTGKTRDITIDAPEGVTITAADGTASPATTVQYPNNYTFEVNTPGQASSTDNVSDGYYYEVTAKVGDTPLTVTAGTPNDNYDADTYTITGTEITGDVTITITKIDVAITRTITISGSGKDDAKITKADGTAITPVVGNDADVYTVLRSEAVKFVLTKQDGYKYTDAEGTEIADHEIAAGEDVVAITVNKTIDLAEEDVSVEAEAYLTMNKDNAGKGGSLWLVKLAKERIDDGHHYEYKLSETESATLVWTTKYETDGAYYMLIQSDEAPTIAISNFTIVDGADTAVSYDGNVNGTTITDGDQTQAVIDVNDAQMVYNMYMAYYSDMDAIGMVKFLEADMNGSKGLNVDDALAVLDMFMTRDSKTTG